MFDSLIREWCEDGSDCDGRLTRYGEQFCPRTAVQDGQYSDEFNVTYPDWVDVPGAAGQRDQYAEMAGY
jgi:hypothetical protein